MESSVPTILLPWVRVPSTPSICHVERTKINKKRPELAHLNNNTKKISRHLRQNEPALQEPRLDLGSFLTKSLNIFSCRTDDILNSKLFHCVGLP